MGVPKTICTLFCDTYNTLLKLQSTISDKGVFGVLGSAFWVQPFDRLRVNVLGSALRQAQGKRFGFWVGLAYGWRLRDVFANKRNTDASTSSAQVTQIWLMNADKIIVTNAN
jgi:hypothetical protein